MYVYVTKSGAQEHSLKLGCSNDGVVVQSTINMYCMLMLGFLEACPPGKFTLSQVLLALGKFGDFSF